MADEERKKIDIPYLYKKKAQGEKVTILTAYDYPTALYEDMAGIEMIIPGNSGMMVEFGHKNTLPATMERMIWMTQAVTRAVKYAFVLGDMPYMSYQVNKGEAIRNAGRFMAEAGADGVEVGGGAMMADTVEAIVKAGIPVMGHIGMLPHYAALKGGFKAQGRDAETARQLIQDAKTLEEAGVFAIELEAIPSRVASIIAKELKIPAYSVGSGPDCDGQILIVHDMLGLFEQFKPKFVKRYAELGKEMVKAFTKFKEEVKTGKFPGLEHCYNIPEEEFQKLID